MANKSFITYIAPKNKFIMVSNSVVQKYDADVVGVYCKIVELSAGKSLSIDFIAKHINVNEKKVRRIVVLLEDEGYIVRELLKDEKNRICGWNYCLYAEPVPKDKRSHAGKKNETEKEEFPVLPKNRQDGKSTKTENGQDNITIDNDIHSNNKDFDNDKDKKSTDVDKKESDFYVFMKAHYPYLMKMDKPLNLQQAKRLKESYGEDVVLEVFEAMDNYKPLLKNYRDAYKTALKWCERRFLNQKGV